MSFAVAAKVLGSRPAQLARIVQRLIGSARRVGLRHEKLEYRRFIGCIFTGFGVR
jgi:hypothetical protein